MDTAVMVRMFILAFSFKDSAAFDIVAPELIKNILTYWTFRDIANSGASAAERILAPIVDFGIMSKYIAFAPPEKLEKRFTFVGSKIFNIAASYYGTPALINASTQESGAVAAAIQTSEMIRQMREKLALQGVLIGTSVNEASTASAMELLLASHALNILSKDTVSMAIMEEIISKNTLGMRVLYLR